MSPVLAVAGFGADIGVAAVAFIGTNVDNTLVTMAMVAGAPPHRAHRIAVGQVLGFVVLVAAAAAAAAVLFEFSAAVIGLLGLVPLSIGVSGLVQLWRGRGPGGGRGSAGTGASADVSADVDAGAPAGEVPGSGGHTGLERRAVGRSLTAAALVTIGAGGDNLAAYIPLFRVGGGSRLAAVALVFVTGEVLVTWLVLRGGRHPRARRVMTRLGSVAVPVLLCGVGVLVMAQAGTFSLL